MAEVESIVSEAISTWRGGTPPDARAIIASHPLLADSKSAVLELAYEEFCLRRETGEALSASTYCSQFPAYRRSLQRLLEVHQFLDATERKPETPWPTLNQELLGYRILAQLGQGRFSRVYLAEEIALGARPVVVKVARARSHEPQTLGRLSHPNIVPVNSVVQDDATGFTVLCMPFLGSATLCDLLDVLLQTPRHEWAGATVIGAAQSVPPLPAADPTEAPRLAGMSYIDAVLALGAQLADGLSYSHARGIVHRDLKPSNVLLTPSGRPLILDFNLSSDVQFATQRIGGTLPYMAPEQLAELAGIGDPTVRPDHRADVFGLGAILYELLFGRLPFGAPEDGGDLRDSAIAALARQTSRPPGFRQTSPRVDGAAARIVERCLALNPQDRYATAAQLAVALRQALRFDKRFWRRVWRSPGRSAAVAGAALALSAVPLGYFATRPPYAEREYRAGVTALARQEIDAAIGHLTRSIESHPKNAAPLQARAWARAGQEEWDLALVDASRARELQESTAVCEQLAYFSTQAKRISIAIFWCKRAIEIGGETAERRNNLGYVLQMQGDLKGALQALNRALELNPDLQPALHNRAKIYFNLSLRGDPTAARLAQADIRRAISVGPASGELFHTAAIVASLPSAEEPESARRKYLEQAVQLGLPLPLLLQDPSQLPIMKNADFVAHLSCLPSEKAALKAQFYVPPAANLP